MLKTALIDFCLLWLIFWSMASRYVRGRGLRTRGGRGMRFETLSKYSRSDNNFFAVLADNEHDRTQDGDLFSVFDNVGSTVNSGDDFIEVRGKKQKRQRVSSGGQSGPTNILQGFDEEHCDYESMSTDEKLSLILSKLLVNENRVQMIQNKLDMCFYQTASPK